MTDEQRREYEARVYSRMPSASLDPLETEKLIGAKEDRPAYRQREQQETSEQESMSLRKKARVRFSPEVQEKEFDPTGLMTKEEAIAVKQMKPDRGFRRDVPVRKKTRAAPDPTVATELLAQEREKTQALMERMKRGKTPPTLHATETSKAYGPEEEEFDPDADAAPGLALQEAQTKLAEMQARRERGRPTDNARTRTNGGRARGTSVRPTDDGTQDEAVV